MEEESGPPTSPMSCFGRGSVYHQDGGALPPSDIQQASRGERGGGIIWQEEPGRAMEELRSGQEFLGLLSKRLQNDH